VRSGLYGAADADQDGEITYREIAAFVARANAAIPNERLRPDVFARPPQGSAQLIDLRPGLGRTLVLGPEARAGHYLLEDRAGNRLLDFHNAPGRPVRILRPGQDPVFLRHLQSGNEYQVGAGEGEVQIAQLTPTQTPARTRGAAHHAFSLIFSLPFDEQAVQCYRFLDVEITVSLREEPPSAPPAWRKGVAATLFTGAVLAGAISGIQVRESRKTARENEHATQQQAGQLNQQIASSRRKAQWFGAAAVGAAAGGLLLLYWPSSPVVPRASASFGQSRTFGIEGRF